ncbi:hypothetical protein AWB80_07535 [Caballeronia pedi]|uniref:Uncharacterized protein n=1 Tax=Caballeronia pedi TaxID=1777141 RepID=A0A158DVA8_9BURK|nr:hypothetical protein [Caballeronia pedi]SAK98494.1 hypothetical protein AWB80_07535 [Caballeronia pedi]
MKPEPIRVPPGFLQDFDLYCARSGVTEWEKGKLRDQVRADFAAWGPVIQRTAAIYRFIDDRWRSTLRYRDFPPVRYAEGLLASMGWFPADPDLFMKCGPMIIFGLCMDVAAAREAAAHQEAA